jgi:hypothetical protein
MRVTDFPPEIVIIIMKYLQKFEDVVILSYTNKYFKKVYEANKIHIYKKLYTDLIPIWVINKEIILHTYSALSSLYLKGELKNLSPDVIVEYVLMKQKFYTNCSIFTMYKALNGCGIKGKNLKKMTNYFKVIGNTKSYIKLLILRRLLG